MELSSVQMHDVKKGHPIADALLHQRAEEELNPQPTDP